VVPRERTHGSVVRTTPCRDVIRFTAARSVQILGRMSLEVLMAVETRVILAMGAFFSDQ